MTDANRTGGRPQPRRNAVADNEAGPQQQDSGGGASGGQPVDAAEDDGLGPHELEIEVELEDRDAQ